jgi:hypothetical protein
MFARTSMYVTFVEDPVVSVMSAKAVRGVVKALEQIPRSRRWVISLCSLV